ncbi:MAG: hypothetical protein JNK87_33775 [Bryobacterales bacterium]|nr:hypothetical protein [Bryobacterales bacterium]
MAHLGIIFSLTLAALAQVCPVTPLSPSQPPLKVLEGERSTESETFQTSVTAVSPDRQIHFYDTASRIRRITPDNRMETLAGNGTRTERVTTGDARANGLPAVGQLLFSRDGVLHFTATGQVFRLRNRQIELVAGSGRPGFNVEEGAPADVNLGGIVNIAFSFSNELLIVDGYSRVRRLDADGVLRTIAGSTLIAAAAGLTGDGRPATQAALSNPRQVVPFPDGSYWIRDLGGRHLRLVGTDGIIRTVNQSFDTAVSILQFPNGSPGASSANRVYPIRNNGVVETGSNPFPPFTGTPRAIDSEGALYFEGSTRPDQRAPLVRLANARQQVLAGAPVPPIVEGQAPPFGLWNPRTNSLLYSTNLGTYSAIVEAGARPRVLVGGGPEISDAGGKRATDLTIYGIVAFTIDPDGRIIVGDTYRTRILVVETSGQVSVLKDAAGQDIVYNTMGSLSSHQRLAADAAGNLYWFQAGATPTGGVFESTIAVWTKATRNVTTFPLRGLYHLLTLPDGTVAAIAGNGSNFRRIVRLTPNGPGDPETGTAMLPYVSFTRWQSRPYFTAANRLFRGEFGRMEYLDLPVLDTGATFAPDYVVAAGPNLIVHSNDGGFYRLEDPASCSWLRQPVIETRNIVNAANGQNAGVVAPRQLMKVIGTGLGPAGGQGFVLDGSLRATGQAAPFPALTLGNWSGTIEFATLSGTVLPVLYSDDTQALFQVQSGVPTAGYLLYYSWQGLQIVHPDRLTVRAANPALFLAAELGDGFLPLAEDATGARLTPDQSVAPGSTLVFIASGLGNLTDNLANGQFCPATRNAVTETPVLTIGGLDAEVIFAGCYPGAIAGTYQIQVRLPAELEPGLHPVTLETRGQRMADEPRMVLRIAPAN